MTTSPPTGIRLTDPGQLLAGIPGLLTFFPDPDSLVFVTLTGNRKHEVRGALRVDLPEDGGIVELVDQLHLIALNHQATGVELVILGGGNADPPDALPHRTLIRLIAEALEPDGIELTHATWAPRIEHDATYWCYENATCTGQLPDPDTSPVTTAMAVAGLPIYASRAELAAQLAADPAGALAHRAELLATRRGSDPEPNHEEDLELIRRLVDGITTGTVEPVLDDATIVRLADALSNPDIREACLAFAFTVRAKGAQRLWTALTRAVPGPDRAEPASLLALCAYLRGEGTLAGMAADAALEANPNHQLGWIMRHVLDYGILPTQLEEMLAECYQRVMTRADCG
jgi:uncharacterized protein DUF4192